LTIQIDGQLLERACKDIIETILFCLPNAFKGTVYLVGRPPELRVQRITSGIFDPGRTAISWGLPERSEYNPPGRTWLEYRDQPDRPLEAMGWCVGLQRNWTVEDAAHDVRSVRLQVEGFEDQFHHMEPVFIRKADLYPEESDHLEYPRTYEGSLIWQDSPYVVVAVIKIHFLSYTIRIDGPECRVIQRLSRALGTELLSYQLRQHSIDAMRQLALDKVRSCNILSDSLRNAITKFGLVFSLIKLELESLRQRWEGILLERSNQTGLRREAVEALNAIVACLDGASTLKGDLINAQNRFLDLFLPPENGEQWLRMQIEERWARLIAGGDVDVETVRRVQDLIDILRRCLYLGRDPRILANCDAMSETLKGEWTELLYTNLSQVDFNFLERLIGMLRNPGLMLPLKNKSLQSLVRLKALAEVMRQLESDTNVVLKKVLNGNDHALMKDLLNRTGGGSSLMD